jgi:membrane protease YdiL (CAAX protease family)
MEANLPAAMSIEDLPDPGKRFPYANWGPGMAIVALFAALSAQIFFAIPVAAIDGVGEGEDFSTAASVVLQLLAASTFLLAPLVVASMRGADLALALWRLGVQRFRPSAWLWMLAAIGAYLLFAIVYVAIAGEPEQEDIADAFGPVPLQILLIVFAASISEEVCFRGMLFGGMRERLPMWAAALLSAAIFGSLHAFTGVSAVPPLIAFGFILALLYEKTGSIVPGILLHMLNNSAALLAQ